MAVSASPRTRDVASLTYTWPTGRTERRDILDNTRFIIPGTGELVLTPVERTHPGAPVAIAEELDQTGALQKRWHLAAGEHFYNGIQAQTKKAPHKKKKEKKKKHHRHHSSSESSSSESNGAQKKKKKKKHEKAKHKQKERVKRAREESPIDEPAPSSKRTKKKEETPEEKAIRLEARRKRDKDKRDKLAAETLKASGTQVPTPVGTSNVVEEFFEDDPAINAAAAEAADGSVDMDPLPGPDEIQL